MPWLIGAAAAAVLLAGVLVAVLSTPPGRTAKSTFAAFNTRTYAASIVGYVPLEDSAGTLSPQVIPAGARLEHPEQLEYGAGGHPAGSRAVARLNPGKSTRILFVDTGKLDDGYQLSWVSRHEHLAPPRGSLLMDWTTTSALSYSLSYNAGTADIRMIAVDQTTDDLLLNTVFSTAGRLDPGTWNLFRVKVTQADDTINIELSWAPQNGNVSATTTWTHPGKATGGLYAATVRIDGDVPTRAMYGHVLGVAGTSDDLASQPRINAFSGR